MSDYHFSVGQISRGKGQSLVASAAYQSGERLFSEYYGEYSDYAVHLSDKAMMNDIPDFVREAEELKALVEHYKEKSRSSVVGDLASKTGKALAWSAPRSKDQVRNNFDR